MNISFNPSSGALNVTITNSEFNTFKQNGLVFDSEIIQYLSNNTHTTISIAGSVASAVQTMLDRAENPLFPTRYLNFVTIPQQMTLAVDKINVFFHAYHYPNLTEAQKNQVIGNFISSAVQSGISLAGNNLLKGAAGTLKAKVVVATLGLALVGIGAAYLLQDPALQQTIGEAFVNLWTPPEFSRVNAVDFLTVYTFARRAGVPANDDSRVRMRALAEQAGRAVWGANWNLDNFGYGRNVLGESLNTHFWARYGNRGSLNDVWEIWRRIELDAGRDPNRGWGLPFWTSTIVPPGIRKQSGWTVGPNARVLLERV